MSAATTTAQPFSAATLSQAGSVPEAFRLLAGPKAAELSSADLIARRDAELRFFGCTPERCASFRSLQVLADGVHRRWDNRIAQAERREARDAAMSGAA